MGGLKTVQCACDLTPQSLPDGKSDPLLQCSQGSQGTQCGGQTSRVDSGTSTQPHPRHSQILPESSKSESQTPCNPMDSPWNSPGQNTGVGSLSLLQGIFPTQGSNPGLPHGRRILYQLSHKGSPRMLEWVAYPFSSRSSRPRNQTRVSCIAGGFFTN